MPPPPPRLRPTNADTELPLQVDFSPANGPAPHSTPPRSANPPPSPRSGRQGRPERPPAPTPFLAQGSESRGEAAAAFVRAAAVPPPPRRPTGETEQPKVVVAGRRNRTIEDAPTILVPIRPRQPQVQRPRRNWSTVVLGGVLASLLLACAFVLGLSAGRGRWLVTDQVVRPQPPEGRPGAPAPPSSAESLAPGAAPAYESNSAPYLHLPPDERSSASDSASASTGEWPSLHAAPTASRGEPLSPPPAKTLADSFDELPSAATATPAPRPAAVAVRGETSSSSFAPVGFDELHPPAGHRRQ